MPENATTLNDATQYTKLVFSSAARKVGWSYLKAAFHGDSHQLEGLSKTSAVTHLGQSFKDVGHSSQSCSKSRRHGNTQAGSGR